MSKREIIHEIEYDIEIIMNSRDFHQNIIYFKDFTKLQIIQNNFIASFSFLFYKKNYLNIFVLEIQILL